MKNTDRFRLFWILLLGIGGLLFLGSGLAELWGEGALVAGLMKILIAGTLAAVTWLLFRKKLNPKYDSKAGKVFLGLGYAFLMLGGFAIENVGIAGFGYVLLLAGLFYKGTP
jgi:hypothetical protein